MLDDAPPQIPEIAARILIIADAAFEDRISHKSDAVFFGIVNDRIRRMTGRIDHTQRKQRIDFKSDQITVVHTLSAAHKNGWSAKRRQVLPCVEQIIIGGLICQHRNVQRSAEFVYRADMIEVTVREEDFLNDPAVFTNEVEKTSRLCSGVDDKSVLRLIVDIEKTVFSEIALYGNLCDHTVT